MSDPLVLLHGLTFDHRHFDPMVEHLSMIAPDRRVLALDLPGHGDSPSRPRYRLAEIAEAVHDQVPADTTPVLVGHSVAAVIATTYAARYPVRGVLNLDQPLLLGPFGAAVRAAEPTLRSPDWRTVWDRFLAGMGIADLPPEARTIVETATDPRPDLLIGYWDEILHGTDDEIRAAREADLRAISDRGVAYHWVTSGEPPTSYRNWLTSLAPKAAITVLSGSHFPHLAYPAETARLAAAM
jgi:pimeloyl-ACP methyl ester carboxylesterase